MIRRVLRCFPRLYAFVRRIHIWLSNQKKKPRRKELGKRYQRKIASLSKKTPRIWYFGVPQHNNLGDFAQYVCIQRWVKENYVDFELVEIPSDVIGYDYFDVLSILQEKVKREDLIIFQSGYTSSDLHDDEKVHRVIAQTFRENKILFFPQTVKYSSPQEARKTADIYNAHRKILFLARDKQSYEIAKTYFHSIQVALFPDIVTSLIGESSFHKKREGLLLCIRGDSEKLYSNMQIAEVAKRLPIHKVDWMDTTLEKGQSCSEAFIQSYIERFSNYEFVMTDRFHGTIIALIANRPVIVLKTTDHKVSEGAKWFLEDYPEYIYPVENLKEAYEKARQILDNPPKAEIYPVFKERYYDKLAGMVADLDR